MKIVVIGGAGLIGAKTVARLSKEGHNVIAASRKSGVNTVTGEGLEAAMKGADVVLDVSNSPSWEDKAVLDFFETSTRNLLSAEQSTGVKHHVALSVVGTDRLLDSGYFRAKMAQEKLIKAGKTPYTIVRATQFFEFLGGIAESGASGDEVRLSSAPMQPMCGDDVAEQMAAVCVQPPVNGIIDIAGPERARLCDLVEKYMKATNDRRKVVADRDALYWGVHLDDKSLVPLGEAKLGPTSLDKWLKATAAVKS